MPKRPLRIAETSGRFVRPHRMLAALGERTVRFRPLYPVLLAAYSVLFVWMRNFEETSAVEALPLLAGSVLVTRLLQVMATRWTANREAGALVAAAWGLALFFYGHLYAVMSDLPWGRHRHLLVVVVLFLVATTWAAARGWTPSRAFGRRGEAIALLLIGIACVAPGWATSGTQGNLEPMDSATIEAARIAGSREGLPDVYYIILDGYGRADVLSRLYSFDNSGFLRDLERLGFSVAADAVANYPTTLTSLASALNLDYLHGPGSVLGEVRALGPLYEAIRGNRLLRLFDAAGYEAIVVSAHRYARGGLAGADRVETCGPVRSFLGPWAMTTLLRASPGLVRRLNVAGEDRRIECQFELLSNLAELDGPKLVFFHVISPHPPFLFRADGSAQSLVETNLVDWNPRSAYVEQVQYVNRRILAVLESLLEGGSVASGSARIGSGGDKLVLVQADHGPASLASPAWSLGPDYIGERVPILMALWPGESVALDEVRSPIAAARWLVESALGLDLPGLYSPIGPNRAYFSARESPPLDFIEVTRRFETGLETSVR